MNCCGQDLQTPYCPTCGGVNDTEPPLASLNRYVMKNFRRSMTLLRQAKGQLAQSPEYAFNIETVAQYQRTVDKWLKWSVALEMAIKAQTTPETNSKHLYGWKCKCGENNGNSQARCWKCDGPCHAQVDTIQPVTNSEPLPTWKCSCGTSNHRAADVFCWSCSELCPITERYTTPPEPT